MDNNKYISKYIKTKNKVRKIITYNGEEAKKEHQFINNKINQYFSPSIFTKGYVKNESIYTNAYAHLYNNYFIKTDIKNFFPNINHNQLIHSIHKELYTIASTKDCRKIVNLCSVNEKGLPLGFITSPVLANIYLKRFDQILYNKLKKLNCKNIIYTRYADDIIISFEDTEEEKEEVKDKIIEIIQNELQKVNLKLNTKKTKFISFSKNKQVRITGITIVEKKGHRRLSVGRNNKRKLFYRAINYKKEKLNDSKELKKIKGLLSFYLSVERTQFEDFITNNMKKELKKYDCDSLIDFIKRL